MTTTMLFEGRAFDALLFDMDGTIITSIVAAERIWSRWARSQGLDVETFLPTIHGMRTIDTVRRAVPTGVDAEQEAAAITAAEIIDLDGVAPIDGVASFLASLPENRWAIVTSASRALAEARLKAAGIALPAVIVTGEDVARGKPHPEGYRLAAERLGFASRNCLVFEDAPAGIDAGVAADAAVVVITTTHSHPLSTPHVTSRDYTDLVAISDGTGIRIARNA